MDGVVKPAQSGYVSLLMLACQQGNLTDVEGILAKPDIDLIFATDHNRRSALHFCTEYGQLECAEYLVRSIGEGEEAHSRKRRLLDLQDNEGFTPLFIATINGHDAILKQLINLGASLDLQDNDGHTLCHWATVCSYYGCLEELLYAKSNPAISDIHGAQPLHYAAQMSAEILTSKPNSPVASREQDQSPVGLKFLRRLASEGIPLSPLDNDQRTPLLWAASSGAAEACKILAQSGADVNLPDKDGLTAVHCAASRGHLKCLQVLVEECQADADAKDKHSCTPFMYAATLGYVDCIRYLAGNRIDKDFPDRKGRTAAHLAAGKGQTESIMEIEDLGGNIWLRNHRGDFPLHEAAQSGYIGLIEFLLTRNSKNINAVNKDGRSCLHIAAMQKDMSLCQFLLENGADVNLVMRNGKLQYFTALDLVNAKGNQAMIKLLRLHGATQASKITRRAATKIQRTFLNCRPPRTNPPESDSILEEAFETGLRITEATPSFEESSEDDRSRSNRTSMSIANNETNPDLVPHLPHEVEFDPDQMGDLVAKERHSDYDEIMELSVLDRLRVSPTPSKRSNVSSPVFEINTLSLNEEPLSPAYSRSPNVRYASDSDDDMKHPELRKSASNYSLDDEDHDMVYANPFPSGENDLVINVPDQRALSVNSAQYNSSSSRKSSIGSTANRKIPENIQTTPRLNIETLVRRGDMAVQTTARGVIDQVHRDSSASQTDSDLMAPTARSYQDSAVSARAPSTFDFHSQLVKDNRGVQTSARNGEVKESSTQNTEPQNGAMEEDLTEPYPEQLHRRKSRLRWDQTAEFNEHRNSIQNGVSDIRPVDNENGVADGTEGEERRPSLYRKFRPPTPRVQPIVEMRQVKAQPQPVQRVTKPTPIKNQTNILRKRLETVNGGKSMPPPANFRASGADEFTSRFNDTINKVRPFNVVTKYLNQLDNMRSKGTKYNEAVVLGRVLPKYIKEMDEVGRTAWLLPPEQITKEIRTLDGWQNFLIDELRSVSRNNSHAATSQWNQSYSENGSRATSNTSYTIADSSEQSSLSGSAVAKGFPLSYSVKQRKPGTQLRNNAVLKRLRGGASSSSASSVDTPPEKLPFVATVHHPFPWR